MSKQKKTPSPILHEMFLSLHLILIMFVHGTVNMPAKLPGCTDTYGTVHNRSFLPWDSPYLMKIYINTVKISLSECKKRCNKQPGCRGVGYLVGVWQQQKGVEQRCKLHNITVQKLKDVGGDVRTENNRNRTTVKIYDRDCTADLSVCNNTYGTAHNRSFLRWDSPHIIKIFMNMAKITLSECKNSCNRQPACRGVGYLVGKWNNDDNVQHRCKHHNITVQELRDAGGDVTTENDRRRTTVKIYDRDCNVCPAGHEISSGQVSCKQCTDNFFKGSAGSEKCRECLNGNVSEDKISCFCSAGYEQNEFNGKCQKCDEGYFKSESGDAPCRPCPPGTAATKPRAISCVENSGIGVGVIIGVVVCCVVVLTAALAGFVCWRKRRKTCKQSPKTLSNEGKVQGKDFAGDKSIPYSVTSKTDHTTITSFACTPTTGIVSTKRSFISSTYSPKPPPEPQGEVGDRENTKCVKDDDMDEDGDGNRDGD